MCSYFLNNVSIIWDKNNIFNQNCLLKKPHQQKNWFKISYKEHAIVIGPITFFLYFIYFLIYLGLFMRHFFVSYQAQGDKGLLNVKMKKKPIN